MRATAAEETQSGTLVLLCLASWAIPGAGHLSPLEKPGEFNEELHLFLHEVLS